MLKRVLLLRSGKMSWIWLNSKIVLVGMIMLVAMQQILHTL